MKIIFIAVSAWLYRKKRREETLREKRPAMLQKALAIAEKAKFERMNWKRTAAVVYQYYDFTEGYALLHEILGPAETIQLRRQGIEMEIALVDNKLVGKLRLTEHEKQDLRELLFVMKEREQHCE